MKGLMRRIVVAGARRFLTNGQINVIETISIVPKLQQLDATVDLYGEPFSFNVLRLRYKQFQYLFDRMETHDCYYLDAIRVAAPTILDLGAHIGVFSRVALRKFPAARIYALEPDIENFCLLKRNLAPYPNASAHQLAVLDHDGELEFFISKRVDWRSTLGVKQEFFVRPDFDKDEYSSNYTVSTTSLDSFVERQGINEVDFVKITIPGEVDMEVLRGARQTLQRCAPVVAGPVYEANWQSVTDFFAELGTHREVESPWKGNKLFRIFIPKHTE